MNIESIKPDRISFAIGMLMVGTITVTASDLIAKTVIPLLSVWQLLLLRSAAGLLILFPALFFLKKLSSINAISLRSVLLRSSLMSCCYICFFISLAQIPIAITAGAFFTGPLFMVLLSRVMLGEKFGIWKTSSLIVGFIGVLLILQPDAEGIDPYILLALLSALLYALTQVVTRKYCKQENPIALSWWLTITFFATGLAGMLFLWVFPSFTENTFAARPSSFIEITPSLIIAFLGLCSVIIHYALSAAYQNAPSSLLGPLEYIYMPLAVLGGYFFYNENPNLIALLGISIIILAGIVVAIRK